MSHASPSIRVLTISAALLLLASTVTLHAQTFSLATGDARGTVTEPFQANAHPIPANSPTSFPITCGTPIQAVTTIVTSQQGFPAPAADAYTTTTPVIQNALNACSAGEAVELTLPTSGGNDAFVIGPIYIPTGVILLIDAGVTVFATVDATAYQTTPVNNNYCGTIASNGGGCTPLITTGSSLAGGVTSGSAVIGYGIINGQGGNNIIAIENGTKTQTTTSWWNLDATYQQGNQNTTHINHPQMIGTLQASNFTLYKITIQDSPAFNVQWAGADASGGLTTGFTAWGVKIYDPAGMLNTDGIDPIDNIQNVSIVNSYIYNGDDNIAIKAFMPTSTAYPVSGISILNQHTYAGLGVTIGTVTQSNIYNVLVNGLYQEGFPSPLNNPEGFPNSIAGQQGGIAIRASDSSGGIVDQITYENVCMNNQVDSVRFYTNYVPDSYHLYPNFTDIMMINLYDLTANVNPTNHPGPYTLTGTYAGAYEFYGYVNTAANINYPVNVSLNNVQSVNPPDVTDYFDMYDTNISIGPGTVSSFPTQYGGKFDLTTLESNYPNQMIDETGSITESEYAFGTTNFPSSGSNAGYGYPLPAGAAYHCNDDETSFPHWVVDAMVASTAPESGVLTNNLQSLTLTTAHPWFTLNAIVIPTEGTGLPGATNVEFWNADTNTRVTTVALSLTGSNGTLASYTMGNPGSGSHHYYVKYTDIDGFLYTTPNLTVTGFSD